MLIVFGVSVHAQDATPSARPFAAASATDGRATLAVYFASLPQGGAGVIYLAGEGVQSARWRFLGDLQDFYAAPDGLYALIPVGLDVTPRDYALSVSVLYTDGTRATLETPVTVTLGNFIRQAFSVAPERAYLTAPEIERTEYARLESLLSYPIAERLWDVNGFVLPLNSEITSPFGAFRTLNETTQTRHTGWDLRAATGTPVTASARGQVRYAAPLDIRGNYILIDHGFGVFTGYAHFSELYVTAGQTVEQGQIIGLSGNTGRSNGPHLHWEVAVSGHWVDSVAFTQMWLPS
jgi:murein DD-endopeptidase MepM/ murein hydrolase activator NlpD